MVGDSLEQLLSLLSNSSAQQIRSALAELANRNVVVPVIRFKNLNDPKGTRRIQVVQDVVDGQRQVHVFSTEELLLSWAGESLYQCFSVAAGDLALTLPEDTQLIFDSNTSHRLVINPELVKVLAWGEVQDSPPSVSDEAVVAQTSVTLDSAISKILSRYDSIKEGYLVDETVAESGRLILGLLSFEMPPEARFALIEEIATLSKSIYGEAGAIEVYDDLANKSTRTWDMFQSFSPFYVREAADKENYKEKDKRGSITTTSPVTQYGVVSDGAVSSAAVPRAVVSRAAVPEMKAGGLTGNIERFSDASGSASQEPSRSAAEGVSSKLQSSSTRAGMMPKRGR